MVGGSSNLLTVMSLFFAGERNDVLFSSRCSGVLCRLEEHKLIFFKIFKVLFPSFS